MATTCRTGTTGCHGAVESRQPIEHILGYYVRSDEDPAQISVWRIDPANGVGDAVYLHSDGSLSDTPERQC